MITDCDLILFYIHGRYVYDNELRIFEPFQNFLPHFETLTVITDRNKQLFRSSKQLSYL